MTQTDVDSAKIAGTESIIIAIQTMKNKIGMYHLEEYHRKKAKNF